MNLKNTKVKAMLLQKPVEAQTLLRSDEKIETMENKPAIWRKQ
jgi:hypothetical protein